MKKLIAPVFAIFFFMTGLYAQNPESKGMNIQDEKENLTESAIQQNFYESAKRAGLTDTKMTELLKIIEERNKVLKDLDTKKKQASAPYSIQDPGTLYNFKINNARNYYAKKISGFLTYKEYCEFAMADYRTEANESARLEFRQIIASNDNLNDDQKKKLSGLVYHYHLHQLVTSAYYSYDKTLQKPKLGILRFNFEKDLKKMCKEYNIKASEGGEGNTNSFQWN
ncbi:hypothetical protein [Flavobacterium sp. N1736]|uniref:hypothetical protein n=1 Tax=Flavobacterium sp. N1736 TaxID=2986823 RepID=UPI002225267A|nr:hypothetical protein [Flavobacterium sp. N1736]